MGRLQLSDSSLLASEQFGLGGYNTVRGYRERVVNGDNALCINTEIRTPSFPVFKRLLKTSDLLYFLVFFDYGHAWDHKKIPGFPLQQTLMGIGPGFRYRISSYFTSRFDIGIPLHNIEEEKKKTRIHLSAVLSY
jgi:hemolysin activation/secretion protein